MKDLNGLILNGGQSTRMGMDKGLIQYHGIPQREFAFGLLREFCDEVFLSCKRIADIPELLNPLPDEFDLDSPLNGIMTALNHRQGKAWITIPVDMPLINRQVIQTLVASRDVSFDATCYLDSDGTDPEPMVCIWEPHCLALLNDFYQAGHKSPKKFLKSHKVRLVPPPFAGMHLNINTPEEMEAFRQKTIV